MLVRIQGRGRQASSKTKKKRKEDPSGFPKPVVAVIAGGSVVLILLIAGIWYAVSGGDDTTNDRDGGQQAAQANNNGGGQAGANVGQPAPANNAAPQKPRLESPPAGEFEALEEYAYATLQARMKTMISTARTPQHYIYKEKQHKTGLVIDYNYETIVLKVFEGGKARPTNRIERSDLTFHQHEPKYKGQFDHGKRLGFWSRSHPNGRIRMRGSYGKGGHRGGYFTCWNSSGKRIWQGYFDKGQLVYGRDFQHAEAAIGMEVVHLSGNGADNITDIAFSPDGRFLATTGFHGRNTWTTTVWDLTAGQKLLSKSMGTEKFLFSPDSSRLAVPTFRGKILVWDLEEAGEPVIISANNPEWMAFYADSKQLLTWKQGGEYKLRRWDSTTGMEIDGPEIIGRPEVISPDGRFLTIRPVFVGSATIPSGHPTVVDLVDIQSGKVVGSLQTTRRDQYRSTLNSRLLSSGFTTDGSMMIAATASKKILECLLFDVGTGKEVKDVKQLTSAVVVNTRNTLSVTTILPDLNRFVLGRRGFEGSMRYSNGDHKQLRLSSVAVAPSGMWLAGIGSVQIPGVPSGGVAVKLVNLATGARTTITSPAYVYHEVYSDVKKPIVAFSPDNKRLLVTSEGGDVTIYQIDAARQ